MIDIILIIERCSRELFKTLQTLISQGIVEKSLSPHYSQILMVPKRDGISVLEDDIDHDTTDTFKPWSTSSSDTDILSLIHFSGVEDL